MTPEEKLHAALAALIIAVVVPLVLSFSRSQPQAARDDFFCAKEDRVHTHILLIVDNTDAYAPSQLEKFREVANDILSRVQPNDMVSLVSMRDIPTEFRFKGCVTDFERKPSLSDALNHPQESWLMRKLQFQRRFEKPLRQQLDQMPLNEAAKASPVFDTLKDATERLGKYWQAAERRELIVFSDMMENVPPRYSQYAPKAKDEAFTAARLKAPYLAEPIDLKGVAVKVYYLMGLPHNLPRQTYSHQNFWRDVFAANGAAETELVELR
jgi:hypothetical protein